MIARVISSSTSFRRTELSGLDERSGFIRVILQIGPSVPARYSCATNRLQSRTR
jgi:hypothetical protein